MKVLTAGGPQICNQANLQHNESVIQRYKIKFEIRSILDSKSQSNLKIIFKIRIEPIFKMRFNVRFKIRFTIRKQKLKLTRSSMYTKNAYKSDRTWICAGPH